MKLKLNRDWQNVLKELIESADYQQLENRVLIEYENKIGQIFPKQDEIFNAFNFCSLDEIKVVILGQDPYPTKGHANGLCFSVNEEVKPFPKSLLNIFKEIESDLGKQMPGNGSLVRWAKQGVLLLNNVLTVEEGKAGSHSNIGWEYFTDEVFKTITKNKKHIVYILWGSKAQEKLKFINAQENLILQSPHPSPLSSYRGFFGCKHFSKTNEYLKSNGKHEIDW